MDTNNYIMHAHDLRAAQQCSANIRIVKTKNDHGRLQSIWPHSNLGCSWGIRRVAAQGSCALDLCSWGIWRVTAQVSCALARHRASELCSRPLQPKLVSSDLLPTPHAEPAADASVFCLTLNLQQTRAFFCRLHRARVCSLRLHMLGWHMQSYQTVPLVLPFALTRGTSI